MPTWSSPCSFARSRGSPTRRGSSLRPTGTPVGRPLRPAREPPRRRPRRPARACRLIGLGSLSSDRSTSTSSRRFRGCPGRGDADRRDSRPCSRRQGAKAVAAARLGAEARFVGAVGDDDFGEPATAALRAESVDLSGLQRIATPTGIALILVDEAGENQIVVVPGANHALDPARIDVGEPDALICQLDVRDDAIAAALERSEAFFCLNAAPARPVSRRPRAGRSDRRQHARARGARVEPDGNPLRAHARRRGRALCSRTAWRSRARCRRRSRQWTDSRATPSPRASSSRCSRVASARRPSAGLRGRGAGGVPTRCAAFAPHGRRG